MLAQEGGADAARLVLSGYNPVQRSWAFAKDNDFWDGVFLAHEFLQFRGKDRRIAVIDTGFDASVPAIAEMNHSVGTSTDAPTAHGTVVALLIREVAPEAYIDLFPVGSSTIEVDEEKVVDALNVAAANGADVINLSLGEPRPMSGYLDHLISLIEPWEDGTLADLPFQIADVIRKDPRWRSWFQPKKMTPLEVAAESAAAGGATVIAAAGNESGSVFSPALLPCAFSAGYLRVNRYLLPDGMTEIAEAIRPLGYRQSELTDFSLVQPSSSTLGSSFAAPLLSGFAALLPELSTLTEHREAVRLAGLAAELLPSLYGPGDYERRLRLIHQCYVDALEAAPHHHERRYGGTPCPECTAFSQYAYIDAGLFWLKTWNLQLARRALIAAVGFSPTNPYAAANLAVTYAALAEESRIARDENALRDALSMAHLLMKSATELRPGHRPYEVRLAEFADALKDPKNWRLQR